MTCSKFSPVKDDGEGDLAKLWFGNSGGWFEVCRGDLIEEADSEGDEGGLQLTLPGDEHDSELVEGEAEDMDDMDVDRKALLRPNSGALDSSEWDRGSLYALFRF